MRDLNSQIPNTPNFKYYEFVKSTIAIRHNIHNIPTEEFIWKNIERLAVNVLQPLRNKFGRIHIESGYRCPKLNVKIGGSLTSNHCLGEAVDIEPLEVGIKLIDMLSWINDNLNFRELIAEYFPNGWIHVAYRENANIKVLKLKDNTHNYAKVPINYIKNIYK